MFYLNSVLCGCTCFQEIIKNRHIEMSLSVLYFNLHIISKGIYKHDTVTCSEKCNENQLESQCLLGKMVQSCRCHKYLVKCINLCHIYKLHCN